MTVWEARAWLARELRAAGASSPEAEAMGLLGVLLKSSRTQVVLARRLELSAEQETMLRGWLARRRQGEPLQYILGSAPFYGLELTVTPAVLIPRPETERLVELVLQDLQGLERPRLLDVGTGSGAIALAIKHERPDAEVWGSDVSAAALNLARENACKSGLKVGFVHADLLSGPQMAAIAREADLLVANLPYLPAADRERVSREVRREPEQALYAGEDGLALYRRLEPQAFGLLRPGTRLWLELDPRNLGRAAALASVWRSSRTEGDLLGRERFLRLER